MFTSDTNNYRANKLQQSLRNTENVDYRILQKKNSIVAQEPSALIPIRVAARQIHVFY